MAVGGISLDDALAAHALAQVGELALEGPQLAQAVVDLPEALVDQARDVATGPLAALAKCQGLLDLAQVEAQALGALEEADAVLVGGAVAR